MISNQTITNLCRDCNGSFEVEVSYNELGATTSFIPKYCPECNKKPKITGPNGNWGTVNIESAKVPQRNVEGLEQELKDIKMHRECQSETNVTIWKFIDRHKLELDVFKSSQAEFNTKQSDFNISVLHLVKEIHKTLIVGFSLLIILMLVTWSYLTYTHFNH